MKTELRLAPHTFIEGERVVEVWSEGMMIATLTGADEPGVRVTSKHPVEIWSSETVAGITVAEVRVGV